MPKLLSQEQDAGHRVQDTLYEKKHKIQDVRIQDTICVADGTGYKTQNSEDRKLGIGYRKLNTEPMDTKQDKVH
jgi:hypothetical protein